MVNLVASVASLAWAAEEGETSGLDLVLPNIYELIAGIVAFLLVFGFIWWKGRPMINRMISNRQETIRGRLEDAEKAKAEAEALLADYRRRMAGAQDEADQIIEEGRRSAEAIRAEILARTKAESDDLTRRAREGIEADRERAAEQLRDLVALLSLELAQKVVAGSVDADTQQVLVDRYIGELEGMPG
jgi:F-type H+-transporting ATPase subunit b